MKIALTEIRYGKYVLHLSRPLIVNISKNRIGQKSVLEIRYFDYKTAAHITGEGETYKEALTAFSNDFGSQLHAAQFHIDMPGYDIFSPHNHIRRLVDKFEEVKEDGRRSSKMGENI